MNAYQRVDARCRTELGLRAHEALIVDPNAFDRIRDEEIAAQTNRRGN